MGTEPIYSFVALPSRASEDGAFQMLVDCPHADRCPGCPLIALPYPEQLAKKSLTLEEAIGAYPTLARAPVAPIAGASSTTNYRVRAKLVARDGKLGLFSRGSHDVVDIPECPVLRPRLRETASGIRRLLGELGSVSSVDLREADEGVLVTLGGTFGPSEAKELAARVAREVPGVLVVATGERARDAPRVIAASPTPRFGPAEAKHHLEPDGPFHYASPGAFTQLHPGQAGLLYATVTERLRAVLGTLAGARLLELYAGSGALALRLSRAGANVTAVESHAPAARLSERAAREQGLSLDARASDARAWLVEQSDPRGRFDAVVVNPPRRGLAPEVRRLVGALAPRVLVYVSCEPETFARDADHLARLGLSLDSLAPFDMIPLSEAVEVVATFTQGPAPAPRVLFENEALVAVSKAPHEPTIPQGEHSHSLLARVRALPGCHDAVPVHRLDAGTSGVCLFARSAERVPELARALGAGTKEYVALVRGVSRKKGHVTRALKDAGVDRAARTRYVRRQVVGGHSLLSVFPEAGRTHQVRRHLAGIGHPVLGDERYGDRASNVHFEHVHALDRTFLHLERVTLALAGIERTIDDELLPDLQGVVASLGRR
jgi:23S rRNA (uracil1939-C5)-methyltransferase